MAADIDKLSENAFAFRLIYIFISVFQCEQYHTQQLPDGYHQYRDRRRYSVISPTRSVQLNRVCSIIDTDPCLGPPMPNKSS